MILNNSQDSFKFYGSFILAAVVEPHWGENTTFRGRPNC
jgi:hypothetical protein